MNQSPPALLPLVVTPQEALPVRPFGLDMHILLSTEASGGATSVIIASHNPGEGPPHHLHHSQEEYIFIVEGTYQVIVNGAEQTVGAGTLLFIPRDTVHSFKNVGDTVGRMLDWTLPGGQDKYFKAIDQLAAEGGFSPEKAKALSLEYDTHFPQV